MNIKTKILAIIILFNSCLYGQTELALLEQYENLNEWQTPNTQVDSILNLIFEGGSKKFLEIIYKNIKFESSHQDNWVKNYLIEIKVSDKELDIKFRNNPNALDKKYIVQAIEKTTPFWKNSNLVKLRILISSDVEEKFNKYISKAYVQLNTYRMVFPSDCNEDECLYEKNEELDLRIKKLIKINEEEGAIYFLKILARRIPFDKKVNEKLWSLTNKNIKN